MKRSLWLGAIVVVGAAIAALTYSAVDDGSRPAGKGGASNRTLIGLDPALFPKLATGVGLVQLLNCAGRPVVGNGRVAVFSGFLVGRRVVMTAEHGLFVGPSQVACRVRVRLDGRWYAVSEMRLWGDPGRADRRGIDVATLKLSRPARSHVFRFASQSPPLGGFVAAIGYPLGLPISFSQGIIKSKVKQYGIPALAAEIAIEGGNSGGPIVDAAGQVVTVVSRGIVQTANGQSLNGGVDLPSWWHSAERDLCYTYHDSGVPGCTANGGGASESRSIVVTHASPVPMFGISP